MKKIGVVTATRAEYGLLRNIIKWIHEDEGLQLVLMVTGTHMEKFYGSTVSEIEKDGFPISYKIDIKTIGNEPLDIANSMSIAQYEFGSIYSRENLDMLLVLGDRYELIPICSSAMIFQVPIAHISGGEITQGAIDDAVRHCITKMSYLHFPACKIYADRLIQLGEEPDRIYVLGDLGTENIFNTKFMSKEELSESLHVDLTKPYVIVTCHPVTLESGNGEKQLNEVLRAMEEMDMYQYIITKSNADLGGRMINKALENYCLNHHNAFLFSSLGSVRYISGIKYCEFVLGNSSSGLYEVPALKKPTVNIGSRQKGRIMADSVINCKADKEQIIIAMKQAASKEFAEIIKNMELPFQGENTAYRIVKQIKHVLYNEKINLDKKFYDINKAEWR